MADDGGRLRRHWRDAPSPADGGGTARRCLIVIAEGVDGAAVRRLVDDGILPTFARLIEQGASGDMAPVSISPMATWGSMATGLPAYRHGLISAMAVRPDRRGVAPPRIGDWRAEPFWARLAEAGRAVATINLPGTVPASDCPVAWAVDPRFAASPVGGDSEWPMPPRCVRPTELRTELRAARVHPDELAAEETGGLPPAALAEAATIQTAALHLLAARDVEFMIVSHPIALRAPGDAALRFLDLTLAALLEAAGPDAELLFASPGGQIVIVGDDVPPDTLLHGAQPEDIAATLLARAGLPVGGGRPLAGESGAIDTTAPPSVPVWRDDPTAPTPVRAVERARARGAAVSAMACSDHAYAVGQLEALLGQAPDDVDLLMLLGQCRFFLAQWNACIDIGARLAELAPDSPWGLMIEGAGLSMTGRAVAAAPLLARAAEQAADDPAALCRLGALAMHGGDAGRARTLYAAALERCPDDADALAGLGLALIASGDLAAGERYIRASLGVRFHAPALHHQLVLLYEHQRRWTDAAAALAVARVQAPETDWTALEQRLAAGSAGGAR